MTGREIFKKYSKVINVLSFIISKLPNDYRIKSLERLRYKSGKIAMFRRYLYLKSTAKSCGDNVAIFPGVFFLHVDKLEIGNNVSFHEMCYIDAEGGIKIGDNVSIAHRTSVLSSNHIYQDLNVPIKYQGMKLETTIIDEDVWIGCGSVILAGNHIHKGSIVGANSSVTHDVCPYTIVVGSPATAIKDRK